MVAHTSVSNAYIHPLPLQLTNTRTASRSLLEGIWRYQAWPRSPKEVGRSTHHSFSPPVPCHQSSRENYTPERLRLQTGQSHPYILKHQSLDQASEQWQVCDLPAMAS